MKLRILGNSIRLRLTRSEVDRLAAGDAIEESTRLAGRERFGYSLVAAECRHLSAELMNNRLVITAPAKALAAWATSDAVALDCPAVDEGSDILIEKDFACLAPRDGSDDEDTFPHPESGQRRC